MQINISWISEMDYTTKGHIILIDKNIAHEVIKYSLLVVAK